MQVFQSGKRFMYDGTFNVKDDGRIVNIREYKTKTFTKKSIKDAFGAGFKNIIEYHSPKLPTIQHIIYTYPDRNYFFIEVVLKGDNLKSGYLAPLTGKFANVDSAAQRSLFVPFDNDAWIRYDAKEFKQEIENTSSEVSAVYSETTQHAIVIGSVEHEVWKSGVKTKAGISENELVAFSGYADKEVTRDQREHGCLEGSQIRSAKFLVGYFADWRTGLEEYAKANRIAEKPFVFNWTQPTPIGWNSWGVLQQNITYDNATKVVDFFADSLKCFRNGKDFYIDLDSYWDKMIKGGYEGDFSELKRFADYCVKRGLKPGVYWAPFTDWGYGSGAQRRAEGSTYTFGEMWTKVNGGYHDFDGARALDPTHPGTQQRIKLVISKLKECGFEMIKIDFLGHAAIEADNFYDKNLHTGMQAYKAGMEYLLKQLDGKMLIYAAISPTMASGRYVHTRRIACDAFKAINETEYTLNSLNYGWWQTYLYNYVDADHVVLNTQTLGENRARTLSAVITGTFITGDDFSTPGIWTARAKDLFQKEELLKLVAKGKSFRPLNGNTGKSANEVFWKITDGFCYLAVFNFTDAEKAIRIDLTKAGLSATNEYAASDVFSGSQYHVAQNKEVTVSAKDAVLLKIKL
ncbi:alpha-amylase family protein [Mucilaginibacter limnophilus]|nr:alpha-galactosidase [Mucilaginibacter limnophilus]